MDTIFWSTILSAFRPSKQCVDGTTVRELCTMLGIDKSRFSPYQLQNQNQSIILLKGQLNKIAVFLKFAMNVYLPRWITATVPASAPFHDLNLINSILQFK